MAWGKVVRIGVKLAGALETAHRAAILHRDVKPGPVAAPAVPRSTERLTDFAGPFRGIPIPALDDHCGNHRNDGDVMNQPDPLAQIESLIAREHELRDRVQAGELTPGEERDQLRRVEVALDQCWDLLRQRRARQDSGQDPDGAAPRPIPEVENYQQ
jgi:hypothetical protein